MFASCVSFENLVSLPVFTSYLNVKQREKKRREHFGLAACSWDVARGHVLVAGPRGRARAASDFSFFCVCVACGTFFFFLCVCSLLNKPTADETLRRALK